MVIDNTSKDTRAGPTGKFPKGKLNSDDDGELKMRIGADKKNKKIIIDFGTPITWIGLDIKEVKNFAKLLTDAANKIK